jgi:flagellar biosynthetic protein FliR
MGLSVPSSTLYAFALVLTRTSALLVALPALGGELVPVRIRAALALSLSFAVVMAHPPLPADTAPAPALVSEALLGAALGLLVRTSLAAAEIMGELVSNQAGFGFDKLMNPLTAEPSSPLSNVVTLTLGVVLFASGAYREVIRGFVSSFFVVPAGSLASWSELFSLLSERAAALFAAGLRIGAPIAGALLATQLGLGLLARLAPQLNVWALGFLVTSAVAVAALIIFLPGFVDELVALWGTGIADLSLVSGG